MIKIKTKWRKNDYGNYYLIGWSVHRRIAKREIIELQAPDGRTIYSRATRTKHAYDCSECALRISPPDGGLMKCPLSKNGNRFCNYCGDEPTGRYKFIEVDFDSILEGL